MAKLTRKQVKTLEAILYHAKRARAYIQRPDIAICAVSSFASTTLHAVRPSDGRIYYEVAKDIGSDLCGLDDAVQFLTAFLVADLTGNKEQTED